MADRSSWPGRVLSDRRWTEVISGSLLVIPLGATEQHGPHLPLDTDTVIAEELARRLVKSRTGAVLAPSLPYGASGEHQGFAGTLSIGTAAVESVLVELVRSADAFAGTILVSGHGGNATAVRRAVGVLHSEGRQVLAWSPTGAVLAAATPEMTARLQGDHHAGLVETSIMLALRPEAVDLTAEGGEHLGGVGVNRVVAPLAELMPRLLRDGVASVSPDGVLGDPSGATAELGHRWLVALAADLTARVEDWAASTASSAAESRGR